MKETDFLTDEVKKQLSSIIEVDFGYICKNDKVEFLRKPKGEILADVIFRNWGSPYPTEREMEIQATNNRAIVVVHRLDDSQINFYAWGDYKLDEPLIGRNFLLGVNDCYEALRAWAWQNEGTKFPPMPRDNDWWTIGISEHGATDRVSFCKNANYYLKYFKDMGYCVFMPRENNPPQIGDGVLIQYKNSPVINHAAVYVGEDTIFHHRYGKQSGYEKLSDVLKVSTARMWVRRADRLYPDKK